MAEVLTTNRALHDGARNVVYEMTGLSTGIDEPRTVKIDVSQLNPPCNTVKVTRIEYDVAGCLVRLLWDGDDPQVLALLTGQSSFDYEKVGGALNPKIGSYSGDLSLETMGADSGSSYSLTIYADKKF